MQNSQWKNMDILYVVGNGSTWANNELRYSLRCIAKNGINVDRIFLVGTIPNFINKEKVICIPENDPTDNKHYNILYKIEQAIEKTDIGKNNNGVFLYSSDDHFYIKPTDFNNYPVYCYPKDLPKDMVYKKEEGHNKWYQSLVNTRKILEEKGLPYKRFNWHGNTFFNTRLWNDPIMKELRESSKNIKNGLEPSSIMLNYWLYKEPFKYIIRDDIKIKGWDSLNKFKEKIKDRECFSSAPNIRNSCMGKWLEKHFPDKCKYEI